MSSHATRTGLARPGVSRLRKKVVSLPTATQPLLDLAPSEARELWVGVHLPLLSVEALDAVTPGQPRAIVEFRGQTQYIVAADMRACDIGVRPGITLAAALALIPNLVTAARDTVREQQLLQRLATRARRFTPRVSLALPDGLVLEVKGSLHLFGGVDGLLRALETDYREAGVKPVLAMTPAPLASLALARAAKSARVTQPAHLIGAIASLSLKTLRWPAEVIERLTKIGVYNVGEALRLPRAGFARRFGKEQLAELDRLTGRDTDLRGRFQMPERFRRKHDLLYELEHHEAILSTVTPVLEELGEFLTARQCGITRLSCLLRHRHAPPTRCVLKLAAPAASAKHLAKLLGERLATLSLPEPVRACEIRSGALVSRAPVAESLWQPGEHGGGVSSAAPELIEHLRARLGHEAVYGLRVQESHRPEKAWCPGELHSPAESRGEKAEGSPMPWPARRRPVLLLSEPESLTEQQGLPRRQGPLRLIEGPERIETGWWEGGGIARDYYVAVDTLGVRMWIFRDRGKSRGWFLQGIFG